MKEKKASKKLNFKKINFKKILSKIVNFIKSYRKILGAILVVLLVVFLLGKLFAPKNVNYPVVFTDGDGDLFLATYKAKVKSDAIKLATSETTARIKYAHTTNRYVLFSKEESLYLYDAKKKDETKEIVKDISGTNYYFTEDDKYVVALDESDNIKVYNFKKTEKIESGVNSIIAISNDHVLFEKDGCIYIKSIKPNKNDRKKVVDSVVSNIKFSKDGKSVVYVGKDNSLHRYDVKKDDDKKIANDISSFYCDEESCEKMIYVESKEERTVYYYDGKKEKELASEIYSILDVNVKNQQVLYINNTDQGKYIVYYAKGGKESTKIDEVDGIKYATIFDGKQIYYITSNGDLKYAKISGSKISRKLTVAESVSGYLYEYKKGFAFVKDIDENYNGVLCIAKNGKAKEIDKEVSNSIIKVNKTGDTIYYFKDYKASGDLYYTKGGKGKQIESDVYSFEYIHDDLIYILKDYNFSIQKGDLYIFNGKKDRKIVKDVSKLATSPVYYEGK